MMRLKTACRHHRTLRDEEDDTAILKSCSFLAGGEKLVVGTSAGGLRLHNSFSNEVVEEYEAHSQAVNKLQVGPVFFSTKAMHMKRQRP